MTDEVDMVQVSTSQRAILKIVVDGKKFFSLPRAHNYLKNTCGFTCNEAKDYLQAIRKDVV